MSRQRIVINLDAPPNNGSAQTRPAGARKRRRWTKVLGVVFTLFAVAIVAIGVVGFLVWRHYQSTPAYALSLMIDAAQRGDVAEFEKRLDDEAIARNMAASASQKAAARYGFALSNSVKQQIDSSMALLLQEMKPAIRQEVAKEIGAFASQSKPRPFVFLVLAVPSLMKITTEGDSAKASGLIDDRSFELTMRRGADGWKVTDFKDDVVVQRIVDNAMTKLPAIGGFDAKLPLLKPGKRTSRRR
jgi:nitrate reductase NapE component